MRKDTLNKFISLYIKNRYFFASENLRITLLNQFLATPEMKSRKYYDQITFAEFIDYLKKTTQHTEDLFSDDYFASNSKSTQVFHAFKFEKAPERLDSPSLFNFGRLPTDLRHHLFASLLTERDLATLAQTSYSFNQEINAEDIWLKKIISLGCDPELLRRLKETNVVTNYRQLYKSISRFTLQRKEIAWLRNLWQLLCLSGEFSAVQYAVQQQLINKDTKDNLDTNPLHYAALSGCIKGIHLLIDLGIKADSSNLNKVNILHYAAMGGDIDTINLAIDELKISPISACRAGAHAAHYAAAGGHGSIMLLLTKKFGLRVKTSAKLSFNPLHTAVVFGNIGAMRVAINNLAIKVDSVCTADGLNILLLAAHEGQDTVMRVAVREFGIDPMSLCKKGGNALHYAAWGGHARAMQVAVNELGIDPLSKFKDTKGFDFNPLHTAALGGHEEAIKFAHLKLGINLESKTSSGINALCCAVIMQNAHAIFILRRLGADVKAFNVQGENLISMANRIEDEETRDEVLFAIKAPLTDEEAAPSIRSAPGA